MDEQNLSENIEMSLNDCISVLSDEFMDKDLSHPNRKISLRNEPIGYLDSYVPLQMSSNSQSETEFDDDDDDDDDYEFDLAKIKNENLSFSFSDEINLTQRIEAVRKEDNVTMETDKNIKNPILKLLNDNAEDELLNKYENKLFDNNYDGVEEEVTDLTTENSMDAMYELLSNAQAVYKKEEIIDTEHKNDSDFENIMNDHNYMSQELITNSLDKHTEQELVIKELKDNAEICHKLLDDLYLINKSQQLHNIIIEMKKISTCLENFETMVKIESNNTEFNASANIMKQDPEINDTFVNSVLDIHICNEVKSDAVFKDIMDEPIYDKTPNCDDDSEIEIPANSKIDTNITKGSIQNEKKDIIIGEQLKLNDNKDIVIDIENKNNLSLTENEIKEAGEEKEFIDTVNSVSSPIYSSFTDSSEDDSSDKGTDSKTNEETDDSTEDSSSNSRVIVEKIIEDVIAENKINEAKSNETPENLENPINVSADSNNVVESLKTLGTKIVEACQKPRDCSVNDFFDKQLTVIKEYIKCQSITVDESTQTESAGNLVDYLNNEEKKRLLEDSYSEISEYESSSDTGTLDEESSSREGRSLSNDNTNTIFNGINLTKYTKTSGTSSDSEKSAESNNLKKDKKRKKSMDKNVKKDKEIDRLLNYKHLANKKEINNKSNKLTSEKQTMQKTTNKESLLDILKQKGDSTTSGESEEEFSENDNEQKRQLPTENDFLLKANEDLKRQLLQSSSESEKSDLETILLSDICDDDSNTSLVDKFLEQYGNEENEIESNDNDKDLILKDKIIQKISTQPQTLNNIDKKDVDSDKENNVRNDSVKDNIDDELLDKSFPKNLLTRKKSFDTLLIEDEKRRLNTLKSNDDHISLSSDDDTDISSSTETTENTRSLRPILRQDQLASETKVAQKEEEDRIARLKKKADILKKSFKEHKVDQSDINSLILDYNTKIKKFIKVHPDLLKNLKQHQIDGVKFMYDCCYGSVNFINDHPGSGCILAHCMGLGKTLQLITLLHTLIVNKELNTSKVLVLCPKSTVMNWADEIQRWLGPLKTKNLKIFSFNDSSDVSQKLQILKEWSKATRPPREICGCLLIGYEAFRSLVLYHNYKKRCGNLPQAEIDEIQKIVKETLLDPGADLVICDEGHIIKNRRAAISQAVQEIKTPRRIILTGTPIQNNLREYYSMVNFIKPSYLGTEKEFSNLYGNPIKNGQHKDSNKRDIKIMKQRSFVLHKKLSTFVQRREAALLKTFLPQKFEYVLFIPMTKVQTRLYEAFLESVGKRNEDTAKGRNLLTDYTCLRKIWTHPKVLENAYQNATSKSRKDSKKANASTTSSLSTNVQSDGEEPDDIYDSQTGFMSVTSDWWRSYLTPEDLETILPSNKLQTMFQILKMCEERKDKCLIFTAFVAVLNVVEYFMTNSINENSPFRAQGFGPKGLWINGKDYYRLDGKTPKSLRHEMIQKFNDVKNDRARVFLISAKAGGQGINLIGANRVIILDTSWNPSNDNQNIFRIFRLGQNKNCYVYRLISMGTMEEKVYSRSVTKQAMSFRVVDEQQIDRHYSMAELAELYKLTNPDYSERPVPALPQDQVLANLLRHFPNLVYKYHEHDSLLENKIEQELSEQEKEDAWKAYEQDITRTENINMASMANMEFFGNAAATQNFFMDHPAFMSNPTDYNLWQSLNTALSPFSNTPYMDPLSMYKNSLYDSSIQKQMESNYLTRHLTGMAGNTTPTVMRGLPSLGDIANNSSASAAQFLPTQYASSYGQNVLNPSQYNTNILMENMHRLFDSFVNNTNEPSNNTTADNRPTKSPITGGGLNLNAYLDNSHKVGGFGSTNNNNKSELYGARSGSASEKASNIPDQNQSKNTGRHEGTSISSPRNQTTSNIDKSESSIHKNLQESIMHTNVSKSPASSENAAIERSKNTNITTNVNLGKRPRSSSPFTNNDENSDAIKKIKSSAAAVIISPGKRNLGNSKPATSTEVFEVD